jgi:hypothetical protein
VPDVGWHIPYSLNSRPRLSNNALASEEPRCPLLRKFMLQRDPPVGRLWGLQGGKRVMRAVPPFDEVADEEVPRKSPRTT